MEITGDFDWLVNLSKHAMCKVSIQTVAAFWGDCRAFPADWVSQNKNFLDFNACKNEVKSEDFDKKSPLKYAQVPFVTILYTLC